jgi:hypothetical protein
MPGHLPDFCDIGQFRVGVRTVHAVQDVHDVGGLELVSRWGLTTGTWHYPPLMSPEVTSMYVPVDCVRRAIPSIMGASRTALDHRASGRPFPWNPLMIAVSGLTF